MKKLLVILCFAGLLYMSVRDVEAEKRVWTTLGGTPLKVDGIEVIKFPGLLVFVTPGSPAAIPNKYAVSGRNSENLIEHVGLFVVHGREVLAKRKAKGLKVILAPTADRPDHGFVDTSDNLRLSDGVKFEEPYSKSRH